MNLEYVEGSPDMSAVRSSKGDIQKGGRGGVHPLLTLLSS